MFGVGAGNCAGGLVSTETGLTPRTETGRTRPPRRGVSTARFRPEPVTDGGIATETGYETSTPPAGTHTHAELNPREQQAVGHSKARRAVLLGTRDAQSTARFAGSSFGHVDRSDRASVALPVSRSSRRSTVTCCLRSSRNTQSKQRSRVLCGTR
jgi:hypothetical protein